MFLLLIHFFWTSVRIGLKGMASRMVLRRILHLREMKSEGREGEQNENTQNEGILIESESENMERMEMETRIPNNFV